MRMEVTHSRCNPCTVGFDDDGGGGERERLRADRSDETLVEQEVRLAQDLVAIIVSRPYGGVLDENGLETEMDSGSRASDRAEAKGRPAWCRTLVPLTNLSDSVRSSKPLGGPGSCLSCLQSSRPLATCDGGVGGGDGRGNGNDGSTAPPRVRNPPTARVVSTLR